MFIAQQQQTDLACLAETLGDRRAVTKLDHTGGGGQAHGWGSTDRRSQRFQRIAARNQFIRRHGGQHGAFLGDRRRHLHAQFQRNRLDAQHHNFPGQGIEQFEAGQHVRQRDLVRRQLLAEKEWNLVAGDLPHRARRHARLDDIEDDQEIQIG